MAHLNRTVQLTSVLALATAASLGTLASAQSTPSAADKPTLTVSAGDFTLKLDREGRIDSAEHIKVRLIPQAYGGGFEVVEVAKRGGRINKGETILRLESKQLQKELEGARLGLDHARRGMQLAQQEAAVLKESNAQRLEQVAKATAQALKELEIWNLYDGPDMLTGQKLSMQSADNRMADQKQELSQLESMYNGTHLAKETKDIVLDRTRRDVEISEQFLKLSKNDRTVAEKYRYPQRDMQVKDAARWAAADEAHAKVGVNASEERKQMELESAAKNLKEAEERVAKLEADVALLTVVSPAEGIMTNIDLEPKDIVNPRQTICEVLDPSKLVVKFNATAADLRLLGNGADVKVALPEYPEVKLAGHVREIASLGAAGDNITNFPVIVDLHADSPLLRIGLRCKVYASKKMSNIVSVPASAVKWEDGQAYVNIRAGEKTERRDVTLGATSDKLTAVTAGLASGDTVVLEEAGK